MTLRHALNRLTLTSAAALMAISAHAADLSPPAGGYKDAPVYEVPTWAGFYVGANIGYGQDSNSVQNADGSFIGAQAGYNFQSGPLVFGAEADLQGAAGTFSNFSGAAYGVNDFGTIRGRAGYAFDRFLVYGTGGVAFGDIDVPAAGSNKSLTGYSAGGGVEFKIAPAWSLKAEYQYVDLGNATVGHTTTDVAFDTFRLGVNWHIGGLN